MVIYLLAAIAFAFLATFAYAGWQAAPWFPTRSSDIGRLLKLADVKTGQKFYDLGCGDGRIIMAAAKQGAVAEGFEISLLPYLMAQVRLAFCVNTKAAVSYKNFWNRNLSDADIVYFFLMPKIYPKLRSKLEKELKPGTKVISYAWPMEGWQPTAIDRSEGKLPLYLYSR
ncbi:MAG: hypothetical protein AAB799_02615 [Patescibacteria group bacterium]